MVMRSSAPRLSGAWLLLIMLLPAPALAGEVEGWLERMSEALRENHYEGVFVHTSPSDGRLQVMKVIHAFHDGEEYERLYSLSGAEREIIRSDESCRCIWPGAKVVVRGGYGNAAAFTSPRLESLEDIEGHYEARMGGEDRVAGMDARIIEIHPRDKFRYGYRLWLASDSAMLLRMDMVNHAGRPIEQTMFTELRFLDDVDPKRLDTRFDTSGFRIVGGEHPEAEASSGLGQWAVHELPAGFERTGERIRRNPRTGSPMRQIAFGDGLSTVSVFIESVEESVEPGKAGGRRGSVSIYRRVIDGTQVTVVGEVPGHTVRLIGDSVGREAGNDD